MLGCALVQQGHRKALALGGHLQEHPLNRMIIFLTKMIILLTRMIHFQLYLLVFLVEVLYCVGVVLRL